MSPASVIGNYMMTKLHKSSAFFTNMVYVFISLFSPNQTQNPRRSGFISACILQFSKYHKSSQVFFLRKKLFWLNNFKTIFTMQNECIFTQSKAKQQNTWTQSSSLILGKMRTHYHSAWADSMLKYANWRTSFVHIVKSCRT